MTLINNLTDIGFWISNPIWVLIGIFQIWMLIDAIRRQEWMWAFFIFVGYGLAALFYFLQVYRPSLGSGGFELPGAASRARIKELEAQIHHLDKAHHHLALGDVYFRRGKFAKAEQCYRATLEREPNDIDARSHLGQALLRMKRPAEAKPLLEKVCAEDPRHEYGYSMMAFAETLTALGEKDAAISVWQRVLEHNSYARARVQLAALYAEKGRSDAARAELKEVISDDAHAPKFQRKRDRIWLRRAKRQLRALR